jgi:hypothetical protein
MRQMISGLVAAVAVVATSAVPAAACSWGYASPCGQGYGGYGRSASYGAEYDRLPEPSPQYFFASQGPTYNGPGMLAPVPTYQESAVSGWGAYSHNYYYGYDGGRYANATNHYYDGAPAVDGPAIYSYPARSQFRPRGARYHGYAPHYSARYGVYYRFAGRSGHREHGPRRYN